ncbi:HEAT repeat domain-containing protein [Neosynechococcus sphagnicola]|uniref:HEAT repeat domain-containing protein n=1 Tax=Neosynechococcus sphagnicola TaxID=1501145 RepID=UPI00068B2A2E|nr:HEAT repeat domain-containing protein [Neosynechococcus sphagnicola]
MDPEVARQAAIALGRWGTGAAVTMLMQRLKAVGTTIELEIEIVRALGWIGTAKALEALGHSLTLDHPSDRSILLSQEIVNILGRVTPDLKAAAAAILISGLQSNTPSFQHPRIRQLAALALGQLGAIQGLEPLIQLLADADLGVRLHTITALKQVGTPETIYQQLQAHLAAVNLSAALHQGITEALKEW